MALTSLLPQSLQELQPPVPGGPSSRPCPVRVRASLQGALRPTAALPPGPRCSTTYQKLECGEGPPLSGLDSIFSKN